LGQGTLRLALPQIPCVVVEKRCHSEPASAGSE
jgi:hypothetical protein